MDDFERTQTMIQSGDLQGAQAISWLKNSHDL
jgi:hypothetical protein